MRTDRFPGSASDIERDESFLLLRARARGRDRAEDTTVCVSVARALAEVHRAGFLHRDVKPSNVLLRVDGTPALSDFGLVHDPDAMLSTRTGGFLGTPAYAPPEQLRGGHVDARADVYSLGASLYHALAMTLPFGQGSTVALLLAIERGDLSPLRRQNPRVPRDAATVIAKAMDADPDQRYASADELADDLGRVLRFEPIRARAPGPINRLARFLRRDRRAFLSGLAAAIVATIATVFFALHLTREWRAAAVREQVEDALAAGDARILDARGTARVAARSLLYPADEDRRPEAKTDRLARLDAALEPYQRALRLAPDDERAAARVLGVGLARERTAPGTSERLELPSLLPTFPLIAEVWRCLAASSPPPTLRGSGRDVRDEDQNGAALLAFLEADPEYDRFALELWGQRRAHDPSDLLADTVLGVLHLARDEDAAALLHLRAAWAALESNPESRARLSVELADAEIRLGMLSDAEALLASMKDHSGAASPDSRRILEADLLARRGRHAEAQVLYDELLLRSYGHALRRSAARNLLALGRHEDALRGWYELWEPALALPSLSTELLATAGAWWDAISVDDRRLAVRRMVRGETEAFGALGWLLDRCPSRSATESAPIATVTWPFSVLGPGADAVSALAERRSEISMNTDSMLRLPPFAQEYLTHRGRAAAKSKRGVT